MPSLLILIWNICVWFGFLFPPPTIYSFLYLALLWNSLKMKIVLLPIKFFLWLLKSTKPTLPVVTAYSVIWWMSSSLHTSNIFPSNLLSPLKSPLLWNMLAWASRQENNKFRDSLSSLMKPYWLYQSSQVDFTFKSLGFYFTFYEHVLWDSVWFQHMHIACTDQIRVIRIFLSLLFLDVTLDPLNQIYSDVNDLEFWRRLVSRKKGSNYLKKARIKSHMYCLERVSSNPLS